MRTIIYIALLALLQFGCVVGPGPGGEGGHTAGASSNEEASASSSSAACGPATCPGCCFNGACQPGTTVAACGISGAQCDTCVSTNHETCLVDQKCGTDPASVWLVAPFNAQIETTNGGVGWDPGGGAPDPFVALWCPASAPKATAFTPIAPDTFTPNWKSGGCLMDAKTLETIGFGIGVYDDDGGGLGDTISQGSIITVDEASFKAQVISLTNGASLVSLNVALSPQ